MSQSWLSVTCHVTNVTRSRISKLFGSKCPPSSDSNQTKGFYAFLKTRNISRKKSKILRNHFRKQNVKNDSWGTSEAIDKIFLSSIISQFSIRILGWIFSPVADWLEVNGGDSSNGTGWCHLEAIIFYQGFIFIKWEIRFPKLRWLHPYWWRVLTTKLLVTKSSTHSWSSSNKLILRKHNSALP